jgi:DNA processing protein
MNGTLFRTPHRFSTDDELEALIALSLVPGVGPGRIRSLVGQMGSAAAVWRAPRSRLSAVPGVGAQTASAIAEFDAQASVRDQFERSRLCGAELLPLFGDGYPEALRQIYDPPSFLWVRGSLTPEDRRAVAVVGTRRPSDYGKRVAEELAGELATKGFTVVSGLAYGIDAVAHRAALKAGGRTIAVLGSGVDRVYPGRHVGLAREIVQAGAVISEYPLGADPDPPNFPRRNRVVSGLSLGVLVVEAYENGGALITARLALEQNREVFAVPGGIRSGASTGTNRLIQEGAAKLVLDVDDILEELGFADASNAETKPAPVPDLDGPEKALFEALNGDTVTIDALCIRTGLDPSTALIHLLNLEFRGLVRQLAGKQFLRAVP